MKMTFSKEFDIIVAGAGIAGISTALAAARHGQHVCLLDKQALIGGLATSGLIFVFLPLCDGERHQVTFGIAEELLKAGLNYGPYDVSLQWGGKMSRQPDNALFSEGDFSQCATPPRDRYAVQFSPAGMILALDELLKQAGIELWLDTRLCDVAVQDGNIVSIEIENNSGRGTLSAQRFIDASGDAHLVRFAGGGFFRGKNKNNIWVVSHDPFVESSYSLGKPFLIQPIHGRQEERETELTGREFTDFVRDGWQYTRDFYAKRYETEHTDRFNIYPVTLPGMPQFRTTIRIDGEKNISSGEYNLHQNDSVGMVGDWRYNGRIWETPYGALIPRGLGNILTSGRCIASGGDSWEAFRVIPACAMTGEVAGTAAALSIQHHCQPRELPLEILRAELQKNGFKFHREEILNLETQDT